MDKGEENKRKHLEFLQLVITRMNVNSFLIKGWVVTIVAALFALAAKDAEKTFIYIAILPCIIFWGLDSYFLRQERLFRHLYDKVRKQNESGIDYSMNTNDFKKSKDTNFFRVLFSQSLSFFYISILLILIGVIIYLSYQTINFNGKETCFFKF